MLSETEAYKEWIDIFDNDVSVIWTRERKELQKAAMLFGALQKEFKRLQSMVDLEYSSLRQQLKNKDQLEVKMRSVCRKNSPKSNKEANKENETLENTRLSLDLNNGFDVKSPDLFRNIDMNKYLESETTSNSSIIDLSISDDDKTSIEKSPTIVSKHRKPKFKLSKLSNQKLQVNTPEGVCKNIFQAQKTDLDSSTIIECTPDSKIKKSDSHLGEFLSKKKVRRNKNTSTLTQMFANSSEPKPTKMHTDDVIDLDETCIDGNKNKSKMSITDLLNFINEENTDGNLSENPNEFEDSMQELDQFSKGAFLEDDMGLEASPPKKAKLIEPEPIVRGPARKLLNGFACQECRDFYTHMNLSPEELQKKMDECSRHRYTHKPPEETISGFWDMTIPSQE